MSHLPGFSASEASGRAADDEMTLEGGAGGIERIITHLTCFFVSSGSVEFFF